MERGARHWPLAALLLASALWGGAITGTKYALRAFDPVTLLSVELVAAARWAGRPDRLPIAVAPRDAYASETTGA